MNYQFTHPHWLWLLPPALALIVWLAVKTHVQISAWRRWTAFALRLVIVIAVVFAIAGLQRLIPQEGMNVYFLLDRSDSIPSAQQKQALAQINKFAAEMKKSDRAGVIVFGSESSIEFSPSEIVDVEKIQAVIGTQRSDIAGAVRLGTAAFPETGQKRLVLMSDGNENIGDVISEVSIARPQGVTIDVLPMGARRGNDVTVRRIGVPNKLKKGQTFDAKIYVDADREQESTVRLYRNEQYLGEQTVKLSPGKNLFTFPQTLLDQGFYEYKVELDAEGDLLPQNNRASGFVNVRGDPKVLLISSQPEQDAQLAEALRSAKLDVIAGGLERIPDTLAEMQSYDSIFLSNISAGEMGEDLMRLFESAVRDFGVGLVVIGGDQSFGAGAYRGTPLEAALPVSMELDSKKVLPKGALALVMHGMEFNNGNQIARDIAFGSLEALSPQDEMGVLLWDGTEKWLFELQEVGNKRELGGLIAGMNQGDLPTFSGLMNLGYQGLKKSNANLKHMIIFSDGDPGAPTDQLLADMRAARITISTVLIAGHAGPDTMIDIAAKGNGRFYDVRNASQLPQIFIKETAVILKSAIFEEPFKPQIVAPSELTRGIGSGEYPILQGYVATSEKARAETPIVSDKGDPILSHWQYGLGRSVAFTSDAKAKWAKNWLGWDRYRQFWTQVGNWSLRRLENADFTTEVAIEKGEGVISVEAVDETGDFRNFLKLQTVVVSPTGEKETMYLEQTGPGRYEARFPTREIGSYMLNLMEMEGGKPIGAQALGASVNYSPEFNDSEPNLNRLRRIAEAGGGKALDLADAANPEANNPFLHDRKKTFQPRDLWEWLLKLAVCLFPLDVAVRRIQIDREEWSRATRTLRRWLLFWRPAKAEAQEDESLNALLARRDTVRSKKTAPKSSAELFQPKTPVAEISPAILPSKSQGETGVTGKAPVDAANDETEKIEEESATDRLLAAKRRARRRRR
ncbi:MAG: VWA domain-containing protein [Verrucomicrobiia bacterium]